ncbi:MAG: prepilin peptidase [Spirochaetes bacterium]|nr:MAG: prepilin peptidase [Spirochaetota bacterium]
MVDFYKNFVFFITFLIFSIPSSVIDFKQKRIPDKIIFPGIIILTGFRIIFFEDLLSIVALKVITGPLIFLLVYLFTHGKLGIGDIKFAALIGVFTGFPGLLVAIGLASLMGLVFSVIGLIAGTLQLTTKIPFAPFLTLGGFLTFLIFNPFI